MKEQHLKINIKDNGIGFDQYQDIANLKSDGLRNIIRRTELMHGKIFLETSLNNGTHYNIEIPLQHGQTS